MEADQELDLRQTIENGRALEAMLSTPGGKRLLTIINEATEEFKREALSLKTKEDLFELWDEARRWKLLGERLENEVLIGREAKREINDVNKMVGDNSGGTQ